MTVSRKRHLWVFSILYTFIFVLAVILILLLTENPFSRFITRASSLQDKTVANDYLQSVKSVLSDSDTKGEEGPADVTAEETLFQYVEVKDSCDVNFEGDCVLVRASPSTDAVVVTRLRNHVILKVSSKIEHDGRLWYKVIFDEYLRYPERVKSDWYIAAEYVDVLLDEGDKTTWEDGSTTTNKRIVVDRTKQILRAYEGEELFVEMIISTGLELSPTPRGTFTIFKKTPSRYMQGPLPGFFDYYDLPGVPWNLYFTEGGAVIHGAYWHDSFGQPYSHGCVNLSPEDAKKLYQWAGLGTKVTVK